MSIGFKATSMSGSAFIIYNVILGINVLVMLISTFVFSRTTVKRIDQILKDEGISLCPWDGVGFKAIVVAQAIAFNGTFFSSSKNSLVDSAAVNRHATARDKRMALVVCISSTTLIVLAVLDTYIR
jgi:hypothetical protein